MDPIRTSLTEAPVVHVIFGVIYLGATLWFLAKSLQPATAFAGLTFALFFIGNGIGLAFPAASMIDFAEYQMEDRWLNLAGWTYLPLLAAGILAMQILAKREKAQGRTPSEVELSKAGYAMILAALAIGSFLILRYMAAEGWQRTRAWSEIVDRHTAYSTRYSFEQVTGQGAFSSVLSAFCLIPTCSLFLLLYGRRWNLPVRLAIVAVPLVLSMLRAAANLQRSGLILQGLVVCVVLAVPLLGHRRQISVRSLPNRIPWKIAAWAGSVFLAVGMIVYARSDDRAPLESLFRRIFVTTSHTGALYFGVFPDMEPYRGWSNILSIPVGSWEDFRNEEMNLKMLGYYANGNAHNANANFVVAAFSGGSWPAATVMQLAYVVLISWLSPRMGRLGGIFPYLAFLLSIHGIFAISQADVLGASSIGFGWEQLLLLVLIQLAVTQRLGAKKGSDGSDSRLTSVASGNVPAVL